MWALCADPSQLLVHHIQWPLSWTSFLLKGWALWGRPDTGGGVPNTGVLATMTWVRNRWPHPFPLPSMLFIHPHSHRRDLFLPPISFLYVKLTPCVFCLMLFPLTAIQYCYQSTCHCLPYPLQSFYTLADPRHLFLSVTPFHILSCICVILSMRFFLPPLSVNQPSSIPSLLWA